MLLLCMHNTFFLAVVVVVAFFFFDFFIQRKDASLQCALAHLPIAVATQCRAAAHNCARCRSCRRGGEHNRL